MSASAVPVPPAEPPNWAELEAMAAVVAEIVPADGWRSGLVWRTDSKGKATALRSHVSNATEILTHDERWTSCLSLNEFSQIAEIVKQPPHESENGHVWLPRPMRDADFVYIAGWLARNYDLTLESRTVASAALAVADRNPHHPVRKYLDSLVWDGTERLSHWLEDFTGARSVTDSANYVRSVSRAWMISAVARIYQPGCKADHVLVLEGAQGILKSTLFKTLGDPWFTDQVADLQSKDSSLGVQGVWIVELAELDAMSRHEVSRIKAFLTVTSDRVRPPYGRLVMRYDRQCVFAGTVNHTDYLRDVTGNRRFWPVRCTDDRINVAGLAEIRDQLWAEAVVAYRAGERWWLEDESAAQAEQEDRMEVDVWEGPVSTYLDQVARDAGPLLRERAYVTLQDVLEEALNLTVREQGRGEQMRASAILKRLRWERKSIWLEGGGRSWRYLAPVPTVPTFADSVPTSENSGNPHE